MMDIEARRKERDELLTQAVKAAKHLQSGKLPAEMREEVRQEAFTCAVVADAINSAIALDGGECRTIYKQPEFYK